MKRITTLIIALLCASFMQAQEKQLTLKDAVYMNREVLPESMRNLSWIGNSDAYAFIENNALVRGRVNAESRDTMLRLSLLNNALKEAGAEELQRFPSVNWINPGLFTFDHGNSLWGFDMEKQGVKKLIEYPEGSSSKDLHQKSMQLAYTVDNNLYILSEGKVLQVTKDEDKGIVNGQDVHRREFGISGGTFWSPDGKRLAFYRKDERNVAEYPLVDITGRIASVEATRYPMAGESSEEVTLGIYDIDSARTIFLETGEPAEQYLTSVSWGPEGKYIYVALLNRDQNHLKLNRYSASSGKLMNTILEEKHPKYVEPEHPLYFLPGEPERFIWFSERDGYQHLYYYDVEGKLINQVTSGNWIVTDFHGFGPKNRMVYFTATADGPLEKHLYRADIKRGKMQKVTYAPGTHSIKLREDKKYLFDIYSSTDVAREYLMLDNNGNLVEMMLENHDPLEEYAMGETRIFTLEADDGTELYCRTILPPDFDPAKKYPVFVYVYGGPHVQMITNSWLGGAGIFLNYMAQQGYVVFTLDNRGSANRGRDFEQAIFRNCGTKEVADQMTGVEYLKSLNYIDTNRIGVDGWSYGGFMTISMMLRNPGTFKVGCAGGPVVDWKYYEVMYGERYMDTPQDNPEGYEEASLLNNVDQLQGKLLIIHGTMDPVVVWQNSLTFLQKCVEEGKQVDYFVYPGHEHNVRGKDRIHLYQKIADYFEDNL